MVYRQRWFVWGMLCVCVFVLFLRRGHQISRYIQYLNCDLLVVFLHFFTLSWSLSGCRMSQFSFFSESPLLDLGLLFG